MKLFAIVIVILTTLSCQSALKKQSSVSMTKFYLALGDSYTIGESVAQDQSFPYQLAAKFNLAGIKMSSPEIIATTGWTTNDLIKAIREKNLQRKYDLVTLLIGVNNQYRGYSAEVYREEFTELLKTAINYAGGNKSHVFVVSIPDWSATPFAKKSGRDLLKISTQIDLSNAIGKEETLREGIQYVDITPASRKADSDPSLIAEDGLHPSGKMYGEWVENMSSKVLKALH
jgi:lysophospholipase L1-like esterase